MPPGGRLWIETGHGKRTAPIKADLQNKWARKRIAAPKFRVLSNEQLKEHTAKTGIALTELIKENTRLMGEIQKRYNKKINKTYYKSASKGLPRQARRKLR